MTVVTPRHAPTEFIPFRVFPWATDLGGIAPPTKETGRTGLRLTRPGSLQCSTFFRSENFFPTLLNLPNRLPEQEQAAFGRDNRVPNDHDAGAAVSAPPPRNLIVVIYSLTPLPV